MWLVKKKNSRLKHGSVTQPWSPERGYTFGSWTQSSVPFKAKCALLMPADPESSNGRLISHLGELDFKGNEKEVKEKWPATFAFETLLLSSHSVRPLACCFYRTTKTKCETHADILQPSRAFSFSQHSLSITCFSVFLKKKRSCLACFQRQ